MKKGLLRSGYTTGACAAAAAKAAAVALLEQKAVGETNIDLPDGKQANFEVIRCTYNSNQASCAVIKDAGDDPDITHGAEISAAVRWKDTPGVSIDGGEGVGRVTRPGLEVPVGTAAINPVPRRMIADSVKEVMKNIPNSRGIEVIISVVDGEKLAGKTLNPRLGIKGGISIIGTTGIVIPYSVNAYKACISQALDVIVASGFREAVITTGRRSEKFAQKELKLNEVCFVQAGDFIGHSLDECVSRRIERVIIWGMTGKISKLAAGHFYTNISDSRVDMDFLADVAKSCGVPEEKLAELKTAATANHFRRMLPQEKSREFCNELCRLAAEKCREKTGGKIGVECIMSDYNGVILGRANA